MSHMTIAVTVLRSRLLTTGEWCDTCALPAAATIELLLDWPGAREPFYLVGDYCPECEAPDATGNDPHDA